MTCVVLIGNGSSQGFADELALDQITTRVRERLHPADVALLDDVTHLAAPEGFEGDTQTNFEAMAGPIDRIAEALGLLDLLSAAQSQRFVGFRDAARELHRIYIAIVGLVFEEIDEYCVEEAAGVNGWAEMNAMARNFRDLSEDQGLAIYTLNYDSLLQSALLHENVAYYDGFRDPNGRINSPLDSWGNPMTMYQLHGSLAWVAFEDVGVTKVGHDNARDFWLPAWADGEDQGGSPVVVLSDLKSRVVQRYPFDLFYQEFRSDLNEAQAVAVAGFGFGDVPVNARLAEYLAQDPDREITVFSPNAEEHAEDWITDLRTIHDSVTPEQLVPVNAVLPADDVFADWPH
jgi:hypothetical protein